MQSPEVRIEVSIPEQRLRLLEGDEEIASFPVSTSAYGTGCEEGSLKTPPGRFRVCQKIGDGAAPGAVFKGRVNTGQIGGEDDPEDLVETRILWLDGLEERNANTRERYIYIHGTNHECEIGKPASHGCVRMRNDDVIALFNQVAEGAEVRITT